MELGDDSGEYIEGGYKPASQWDSFFAQILEALCKWRLSNDLCSKFPSWNKSSASMKLGSYRINLTRYWISGISGEGESINADQAGDKKETVEMPKAWLKCKNKSDMFPWDDDHNLQSWSGLEDFIVMECSTQFQSWSGLEDCIVEECIAQFSSIVRIEFLANTLLQAARIIGCQIPLFVQLQEQYASLHESVVITEEDMRKMEYCESLGFGKISKKQIYSFIDWEDISQVLAVRGDTIETVHYWNKEFSAFYLDASWLDLQEIKFVEDDYPLVDLDPLDAHKWTVLVNCICEDVVPLGDCLKRFLDLCSLTQTESLLLNPQVSSMLQYRRIYKRGEVNASLAMQGLIEPKVRKVTSKLMLNAEESHIPVESLNSILDLLFSDVKLQKDQHSNGGNPSTTTTVEDEAHEKLCLSYEELPQYFKSAQLSSLIGRLAMCMCIVSKYHGGMGAVNQLWAEFVLEMKYCLENNCEIKGLEPKGLNMDYPELLKNLQVLNSCIEKRKARDAPSPIAEPTNVERFMKTLKIMEIRDMSDLIEHSINKSEDLVEHNINKSEDGVDTSRHGSLIRVPMLIDRLSYVKAFIAANPGYVIEDFIRWCTSEMITDKDYPNQWIRISEDVSVVFHKNAQTQSFPDGDDAAEVFHWLASLKPSDLVIGLMPVLINLIMATLLDRPESKLDFLEEHLNQIKVPPCNSSNWLKEFKDVIEHLTLIAEKLAKTRFLLKKFRQFDPSISVSDHELEHFVFELIEFSKASIPTSGSELPSHTNLGKIFYKYLTSCKQIENDKKAKSDGEAAQDLVVKPEKSFHIYKLSFSELPHFVSHASRTLAFSDKVDITLDTMLNKDCFMIINKPEKEKKD